MKIYVAGHKGLVGSTIIKQLILNGVDPSFIIVRTHKELDLTNQQATNEFFKKEKPDQVYFAAAKVGGVHSNNEYPAEFIYKNLMIQTNTINAAHENGVNKLLMIGSTCVYPKFASNPITEDSEGMILTVPEKISHSGVPQEKNGEPVVRLMNMMEPSTTPQIVIEDTSGSSLVMNSYPSYPPVVEDIEEEAQNDVNLFKWYHGDKTNEPGEPAMPEPWDPDWICKPRETVSWTAIIAYLEVEGGQLSPNLKRFKKAIWFGLDSSKVTKCLLYSGLQ
jgi:hypothetical protein